MIWADLHCHTTCSDGTVSPCALIQMAKELNLRGLCITDHDTVAAYPEAIQAAREARIHLGTGIEFSSVFAGHDVHILGYDIDLESEALAELCKKHESRRTKRNQQIVENLRKEGMEIPQLSSKGILGRPHIAAALVEQGHVSSIKEAFRLYLGEGKRCYVRGETVSIEETIRAIHAAKGKAFLAHPHLLPSNVPIPKLLENPFDGIECFYGTMPSSDKWQKVAAEKKLFVSGGSDFHGATRPHVSLGCQGVDEKTFNRIFNHVCAGRTF